MADREYRIKIITVADNAGASAAASGLRDVTNAAGDSGKAQEKAGEAAEGHHKSLLHAESGAKQLHQTLHLLTEQAPLLGLAMEAAITPVGAALAAAAVAFHTISKNLEELNKQLDEMADSAAKPLTNIHESVKRATASIKEMNQEYSEFIRNSKEAAGLSKEGLDSDSQALEAQSEQLRENLKLQTDLEKLRIEQSNSLPAQKAAALAALDANSQDAERALGAQQREKQLALDQAALDKADKNRNEAQEHVTATQGAMADPNRLRDIEQAKQLIDSLEDQNKNFSPERKKQLEDEVDKAREAREHSSLARADERQRELEEAQSQLAKFKNDEQSRDQTQWRLADLENSQSLAKTAYDDAKKKLDDFKAQFDELNRKVARESDKNDIINSGEASRAPVQSEINARKAYNDLGKTQFGGEVESAAQAAWLLQHGGQISAQQQSAMQQLEAYLQANGYFMQQVMGLLAQHSQNIPQLVADIQALMSRQTGSYNHP